MKIKQENIGVILALSSGIIFALFPVFVKKGTQVIPPITYAGLSVLTAFFALLFFTIITKKIHEIKIKKIYPPIFMITTFIIIIPYILYFIGASKTSGINTSLLLLAEIIFTVLITPFYGEKNSLQKIYGASGVFLGAVFILYNGTLDLNIGDILIIISTASYPIGNLYTKKALNMASPVTILTIRSLFGALFLLLLAKFIEPNVNYIEILQNYWYFILGNGILIFTISKIIDYEALKRLDISKAIALFMTFPIFSLIILLFMGEKISIYQWIGFVIMMTGIYISAKRKSVDPQKTLYAN